MRIRLYLSTILACAALTAVAGRPEMPRVNGEIFPDVDGKHINAHGGNIICHDGTYYWYGEHRGDGTPGSYQQGVICYSSDNLKDWTCRGIVMAVNDSAGHLLEKGCTIERPKVVYCPATGRFVMWFHHELKGRGYGAAYVGSATADNPVGPFEYKGSGRVNAGIYPVEMTDADKMRTWGKDMEWWTPEWREAVNQGMFNIRDHENGQMSRDMTIFVDDDGKAYHIYSSEENLTLQIAELDSTYEHHTGKYKRIFPGGHNEAPAVFKHDGTYWMITSGCTGWAPNEARLMRADSLMGEWSRLPNPCHGPGADTTFDGQSAYVFVQDGKYTFMADKWRPKNLGDSRHIWLPIQFDADGVPFIEGEISGD